MDGIDILMTPEEALLFASLTLRRYGEPFAAALLEHMSDRIGKVPSELSTFNESVTAFGGPGKHPAF